MMSPVLIKAFGVCDTTSKRINDFESVFSTALQKGFFINPAVCNEDVVRFINHEAIDYNSTFYKNWQDVETRTRFEQLFDQILHYFTCGEFVLNDGDESDVPDFKIYKYIGVATVEEVASRCINLLTSGIAMSNSMVNACVDYIVDNVHPSDIPLDDIQNREAMVQLCDRLNIAPRTGEGIVRWLVYKATGNAMVIKDFATIRTIKLNANDVMLGVLDNNQLVELSRVFFRYKPLILALKANVWNKKIVNRVRRMANLYHTPAKNGGFWQTVLGEEKDFGEILKRVKDLNSFKIIALIQTINERYLAAEENAPSSYIIRNGKVWKENVGYGEKLTPDHKRYLDAVREILYSELVVRLSNKAGTVKFPTNLNLTCPVSEKTFMGNIPYGSSYELSNHNYFGIYWRNEDGAHDLDLSFVDKQGYKIGWNAGYNKNGEVVFSGDMIQADPCATEVLYFKGGCKQDGVLWVNRYNGQVGSKYKYFFGREDIKELTRNYMVDPNSIEYEEWSESVSGQEMLGVMYNNKIYPCKFRFGERMVSGTRGDSFDIMVRKLDSQLKLKDVLLDSGFKEYVEVKDEEGNVIPPDYDFTSLDKDTLIELFS